jgi:hypothetical protein
VASCAWAMGIVSNPIKHATMVPRREMRMRSA